MSHLPTQPSTVRALARFNRGLETSATPRLLLGSALTAYGSLASVYVGTLLIGVASYEGTSPWPPRCS